MTIRSAYRAARASGTKRPGAEVEPRLAVEEEVVEAEAEAVAERCHPWYRRAASCRRRPEPTRHRHQGADRAS